MSEVKEEWRATKSLPPHIEVSNLGNIRRYVDSASVEPMNTTISGGYLYVSCGGKSYAVHRLVAEAFIENPDPEIYTKVGHKNSNNKLDNSVENLEWLTAGDISRGKKGIDSRQKIYCKELDQVFGSLRSACLITQLPQELISASIREGATIAGMTFSWIKVDDPILKDHSISYITLERAIELGKDSNSKDELKKFIDAEVGEGTFRKF